MRCRDRGAFLAMITRLFFLVALLVSPALAQRNIGSVEVNVDSSTVPVRVSANTPELNALVLQAFKAHGRYRLVASGQAYDIRFTLVFVTHSIEEAVILGSRILVLSPHPGQVRAELNSPGFSYDARGSAEFQALVQKISTMLFGNRATAAH